MTLPPPVWSWRPAPTALSIAAAYLVVDQALAARASGWPLCIAAALGAVVALVTWGMFIAGWWTRNRAWDRRGYFVGFTLFAGRAWAVGHLVEPWQTWPWIVLAVLSFLSWLAECGAAMRAEEVRDGRADAQPH